MSNRQFFCMLAPARYGWLNSRLARVAVLSAAMLLAGCQSGGSAVRKADPKSAVATRAALAAEYIRQGDLDAAQRSLAQALAAEPRSVEANNLMGVLLHQEGSPANVVKAESYFKKAIAIDPGYAQARNNYGVYLNSQKRYREAVAQLQIAGATLGYEGRAAALENLGRTYRQLGNHSHAEKTFKQALGANRDSMIARLELADIYLERQQLREASALYNDYLGRLGAARQGSRALWLGIRIARAERDTMRMKSFINQLAADYPDSPEYQRYLQLQQTSEALWK